MNSKSKTDHIQVREERVVVMQCRCGDEYRKDLYRDLAGDLETIQATINAFRQRHASCVEEVPA